MATHRELEAQIRFQLEQLSIRNAHHDFEHLCRHLVRSRICSNILPATGPVSAGGDQGRDFETYEASIHEVLGTSIFFGNASSRHLTFACSLQEKGLPTKVKSDVKVIMDSGAPVDGIHYLCASDIAVAKRHELQAWTSSEYAVSLEIHDGQWIAQELTQRDIFWIAQEFLQIAREAYPDASLEDAAYAELRQRWEGGQPTNLAQLLDVSYGLREAARAGGPSEDLSFWFECIHPDAVPAQLRRHAIYETTLASMRGRNTMEGLEPFVEEYFSGVAQLLRTSELDDAVVMLGFCLGASGLQRLGISSEVLRGYASELLEKIDELLLDAKTPGYRAQLLFMRGFLAASSGSNLDGLQSCLGDWEKALDLVEHAPLFPVADLADLIAQLIDLLPRAVQEEFNPRLLVLAERVDRFIEERFGAFAAASRCKDRGMTLYKKQDLLGAIEQFHRAKKGWFAEETLQGSILAILFLSKCYYELGLRLAGKYYALAAAFMALTTPNLNLRRFVPQGLFMAADADYVLGAWCNYLLLSDVGLRAFAQFGIEKDAASIESEINIALFHSGVIYAMSSLFAPDCRSKIKAMITAWDLADDLDDLLESADEHWLEKDLSEVECALHEEGIGTPFSDLSRTRQIGFRALGIDWSLEWNNTHSVNAAGEHFTAVLQVVLADLARLDLCLLPAAISVSLRVGDATPADSLVEGDRPGEWLVTLPDPRRSEDFEQCVFTSTTGLLAFSSALHMKKTQQLLEERLQKALRGKTFCVRPFTELLGTFVVEDDFLAFERGSKRATEPDERVDIEHPQLAGPSGPGPGYQRAVQEAHITNRYRNLMRKLGDIMPRIASCEGFHRTVATLRKGGWKDWHILLATYNAIVNHLAQVADEAGKSKETAERISRAKEIAKLDVLPPNLPISDEVFSTANLRLHLRHSMTATLLQTWDLRINTHGFDFAAVESLLSERYAYWSDDVEHEDLGF